MHRSASMIRQSSAPSTRRMNTFVPPKTNVASVCMNVPRWNSGPLFRYTSSALVPVKWPYTRPWAMHAVCDSIAPLGRPLNAAV